MASVIAVVKLAPGVIGYYDELSRIYLNMQCKKANVYSNMNTSRIRRAIAERTLELVSGTLVPVSNFRVENVNDAFSVAPELTDSPVEQTVYIDQNKTDVNEQPNDIEDIEVEEEPVEITSDEKVDEPKEEVVEETAEESKPKRTRKKKEE